MQRNKKIIIATFVLSVAVLSTIVNFNTKNYKTHKRCKHNIIHVQKKQKNISKTNSTKDKVVLNKSKTVTNIAKTTKLTHNDYNTIKPAKLSNRGSSYEAKTYETKNINTYNENNKYYDVDLSHEQQDFIRKICMLNGFSFELGISLCYVESNFNNLVANSCSATGYFQVQGSTAEYMLEYMSIHDKEQYNQAIQGFSLNDFKSNCRIGLYTLKYLQNECNGNIQMALSRYNGKGNCYSDYSELVVNNCDRLRNGLGLSRE